MTKRRFAALGAALLMAALSVTGCKKDGGSSDKDSSEKKPAVMNSDDRIAEAYKDVEDLETGPELSVSRTSAPAGGVAEVTISVDNADEMWNMCGLHIEYSEELKCQLNGSAEAHMTKYKAGDACDGFLTSSMEWFGDMPEDLAGQGKSMVFFAAVSSGNPGVSGDIVTFYLDVPEDAEPGTVYPIDFYYYNTDQFTNINGDKEMEKYAFTHWKGGSVTVE